MQGIDGIIKFTKLIHDFQTVERAIHVTGDERFENDVEHSYQLALVGWYIVSVNQLPLDLDKVIKYALIHDLVEVYAGDTDATDPDPTVHATKQAREHEAYIRLKEEFSEFSDMIDFIESYETKHDEESRFVYSLDKLLPPMNIYLDNGRVWKSRGVGYEMVKEHGSKRVAQHEEIKKYFDELMEILKEEQQVLFPE